MSAPVDDVTSLSDDELHRQLVESFSRTAELTRFYFGTAEGLDALRREGMRNQSGIEPVSTSQEHDASHTVPSLEI